MTNDVTYLSSSYTIPKCWYNYDFNLTFVHNEIWIVLISVSEVMNLRYLNLNIRAIERTMQWSLDTSVILSVHLFPTQGIWIRFVWILSMVHIDGLVQDCRNTSALTMELLQSCTTPPIKYLSIWKAIYAEEFDPDKYYRQSFHHTWYLYNIKQGYHGICVCGIK